MYKTIVFFLVLLFGASVSAEPAACPKLSNAISSPDFILTLNVDQIAPGTAKAVWASSNDGPFTVVVEDISTNLVVFNGVTFDDSIIINNLQPGKYTITVSDNNNALVQNFSIQ